MFIAVFKVFPKQNFNIVTDEFVNFFQWFSITMALVKLKCQLKKAINFKVCCVTSLSNAFSFLLSLPIKKKLNRPVLRHD